ncbi:hypothetical protein [Microbulbifer sp. ARAS458-1]|uniref:hypothetical protein n=1 Tax=Microbulbifer sp. ARAS458-1 TaxID=3140242 RepID=UPI003877CFF3
MRNNSETFDLYNTSPQRALRLVVVIEFPTPVYLASHGDIPGLPGGALGGVLAKVSSTSQRLIPEQGRAEIGAINFELVDVGGVFTDTLRNQLQAGNGIKGRTVRLYQGGAGMDWADFRLEQTQVAEESLGYDHGRYRVRCRDIQREMRKDIFVPRSTRLAADFPKGAGTLSVYSTADFEPCPHTASFGDAPGQTVYYLKIKYQNGWEVVRATGKTGSTFTGVTRGLFGTVEYDHTVPTENDDDKGIEVEEFIYLELPAPALAYALLTGKILGTSDLLPANWHLGIDPSLVVADEFENIGTDWYKPGDYTKGVILRFDGLAKTDGKKFIEQEINLLMGAYMPVNAAGQLGYRRMTGVLADAGTVATITADDVLSLGELQQDLAALRNIFSIQWAWYEAPGFDGRFLRSNVLADADSIAHHGESKPQALKFRGLHNSRHTFTTLKNRFDALRDRFAGPPLRLRLSLLPSNNDIEVGDVVRVTLPQVRDYTSSGTLDRAMEVQRVSVDQVSGGVQVELFGSTQKAAPIADEAASTNAELPDGWYSAEGTAMAAAGLTIDGSGFLTADGTLDGAASSRTIYYYLGDLTIPAGRTLTVTDNVELRVMGVLQVDGTLRGAPSNSGAGFLGSCRGGVGRAVGKIGPTGWVDTRGEVVTGRNAVMPTLTIDNDGGELVGIPSDLRGSGGARGGHSYHYLRGDNSWEPAGFGGIGGQGGAGVAVVARGIALGVSGKINTSGGNGLPGNDNGPQYSVPAGSGGGGAPGGVLLIIDGHQNPQPVLTNSKLVACYGDSPSGPGNAGSGGTCLGVNAARVYTVPKSRTPYPNYTQDQADDPLVLQAIDDAAQAAQDAAAAQSDATSALAKLDDIGADGKLHPSEKLRAQLEYSRLIAEQAGIEASATVFSITTEKTAYSNAVAALTSYLGGLSPNWNDTSATTTISRTLWNSNWQAVYDARQALLNEISAETSHRATWAEIIGSGKPEDGATRNLLAYDPVTKKLTDTGADILTVETLLASQRRGERTIGGGFFEAFTQADSADDWFITAGVDDYNCSTSTSAIAGGYALKAQGFNWLHYGEKIPFDRSKLYRMEVRVWRAASNEGTFYAGLDGYDFEGNALNKNGDAGYSSQHYVLAQGNSASGWQTYVTYIKGTTSAGQPGSFSTASGTEGGKTNNPITNPGKLVSGVCYIAPMLICGYNGGANSTTVDYIRIDVIDEDTLNEKFDNKIDEKRPDSDYKNSNVTKGTVGLANVENKSSAVIRSEITQSNIEPWAPRRDLSNLLTGGLSFIDGRANSRIGALRPDSAYKNSNTTPANLGFSRTAKQIEANALFAANCVHRKDLRDTPQGVPTNSSYSATTLGWTFDCGTSGDGWIHCFVADAEGGIYIGLNGVELGPMHRSDMGLPDGANHPGWFTFPCTVAAGTNTVKVWANTTDGASLYGVVVTLGGTGDPTALLDSKLTGVGLGVIRNGSSWTNQADSGSDGEIYIHGFDEAGNPVDGPGFVVIDGKRREVPQQSLNPGSMVANHGVKNGFIVMKRSGSTWSTTGGTDVLVVGHWLRGDFYIDWYNSGNLSDKVTPTDDYFIVGEIAMAATEDVEAVAMYREPKPLLGTSRMVSGLNHYGRAIDQRTIPQINSSAQSGTSQSALSAIDNGSTAKIDISAHSVQYGFGSVSYSSGSVSGLSFSTRYYIYCDDEGYVGGSVTYVASTNKLAPVSGTHRRYLGSITTPSNGGSSSGGQLPGEWCVVGNMYLAPYFRARDAYMGDYVDAWDEGHSETFASHIEAIVPVDKVDCVRLVTESCAAVQVSMETPITLHDGRSVRAQHAIGGRVAVVHGDSPAITWEKIIKVKPLGERRVYRISVGGISYAAGEDPQHRVITHNAYKP